MNKWEYKIVTEDTNPKMTFEPEQEINKLGKKGWELVSVCHTDGKTANYSEWTFKRLISQ